MRDSEGGANFSYAVILDSDVEEIIEYREVRPHQLRFSLNPDQVIQPPKTQYELKIRVTDS